MSDDRPSIEPVSAVVSGRGAPLPPRIVVVVVSVALGAFVAGLQMRPTPEVPPPPSASSPVMSSPESTPETTTTASAQLPPPTPLAVGIYHVTEADVSQLAEAARFYAAYNAGDLATTMSFFTSYSVLSDCDYVAHTVVTVEGRPAIEPYLRARFAEHDRWTVEFYQVHPADPFQVVVVPLERANDTIRRLGAATGVKKSFPILLSLEFNMDRTHLDGVQWGTVMGPTIAQELCTP